MGEASAFETVIWDVSDGAGLLTLNRPEHLNAFNARMRREVRAVWQLAREDDDVRVVVVTGAGGRAFCTGIDGNEAIGEQLAAQNAAPGWEYEDPSRDMSPKTNGLWKPVIAAVNGMACGGAFSLLGEVEFIVASENATFFDPHVSFAITAASEPVHLLQSMPFNEIMRLALMGSYERLSAGRALEIGMVSEVVPSHDLLEAAMERATVIASQDPHVIQGTLRALWTARELPRRQALDVSHLFSLMGNRPAQVREAHRQFVSGERVDWRLR